MPFPEEPQVKQRFWAKVNVGADTECWPWTAYRGLAGYGQFAFHRRRLEQAHRVAWQLTYGPIPPGLFICHRCDNPPCVNPRHLFLGTRTDNVRDMWSKGRAYGGPQIMAAKVECKHGHAFTAENTHHNRKTGARECRACHRQRETIRRQARQVGSKTMVSV